MLTRLKELAREAADSTISSSQRTLINNEQTELTGEIDKIANSTKFNGRHFWMELSLAPSR